MKKLIIVVLVLILFVTLMLSKGIYLVKNHDRIQTYTLPKEVQKELSSVYIMDCNDVMHYSVKYTANNLKFSEKNELDKGKANCIGYAQYCSAVANFLYKHSTIKSEYKAKPVVGVLKIAKLDLCKVVSSIMPNSKLRNFTKDHDFVEFDMDGDTIYVDPCLYDFIGDDCRTGNEY
jgi:hypothetical protein